MQRQSARRRAEESSSLGDSHGGAGVATVVVGGDGSVLCHLLCLTKVLFAPYFQLPCSFPVIFVTAPVVSCRNQTHSRSRCEKRTEDGQFQ